MTKRTKNRGLNLRVRSHTDCVCLWNAVHEYGKRMGDEYHYAALRLLREGDKEGAERCFRYRDQVSACTTRTLARLEVIQRQFENLMDDEEDDRRGGGWSNNCPGDVAARDSF